MTLLAAYSLIVETVGIPADESDKARLTACVSSQVTIIAIICALFTEVL